MAILETPFARLELQRFPTQHNSPLQAFNAADEYLLQRLHDQQLPQGARILVINDNFGALALSLSSHYQVSSCSDSVLATLGLQANAQTNALELNGIEQVDRTSELSGQFAAVLIQVPKTLALLEDQLAGLQDKISADTLVLAGAMIKHLPRSAGDLLEKYIGPVQASLAVKKARLLQASPHQQEPLPIPAAHHYRLSELDLELVNHAGIFSREGLDVGTRLLLQHLPQDLGSKTVADLGCGNGVLALACALKNPDANFVLVDESRAAVHSAQDSWTLNMGQRPADIRTGDGLYEQEPGSLDLVLCNPPFHQLQAMNDFLALRMFRQAHRALKPGGELLLVGNRHLGYHVKLKRWFASIEQVAAHPKFVVLRARKRNNPA